MCLASYKAYGYSEARYSFKKFVLFSFPLQESTTSFITQMYMYVSNSKVGKSAYFANITSSSILTGFWFTNLFFPKCRNLKE